MRSVFAIVLLALMLPGCGALQGLRMADWTRDQGGEIRDARLVRVERVGNTLSGQAGCGAMRFHVLSTRGLSAYSWPTGDVFLTAGLVDAASDDELAAAIAHEMGHLLSDGKMKTAVSLHGVDARMDVERRADLIGCEVLAATGRSPRALARVLEKVGGAAESEETRRAIGARVAVIQARFGK